MFNRLNASRWFRPVVFILAVAIGVLVNLPYCDSDIITYDSAYQYALTQHSLPEIRRLVPEDYSPPLPGG